MKLHHKKVLITIVTFVILCIVSIACTAFTFDMGDTTEGSNSNVTETSCEVKTTIEETTSQKTEKVDIDTTVGKTERPTEVKTTKVEKLTTKPTTISTTKVSNSSYTQDDLFYLAAAICREAGGSSTRTQMLVANVIVNRVNSKLYPNTIYGVLTQYMQYGMMWRDGVSFPKWADTKTKEQCYAVAKRILNGERVCPENVLFQAEFKQGSGVYEETEGFYFCYY